jgi:hypothetical protein
MKTIAHFLVFVTISLISCIQSFGATCTWDGGGGDNSWQTPENWSGDTLPGPSDDVVIPAANTSVLVTSSVTINGLTLGSGVTLTVQGTAAVFTANGTTIIDGANLYAESGAQLSLPRISNAIRINGNDVAWQAKGAGSRVALGGLTNLISYPDGGWWRLRTYNGGRLELPAMKTMTNGWFDVYSDGGNSLVDLSNLTAYQPGRSDRYIQLDVRNGGTIQIPKLASLNQIGVSQRGPTSVIPLIQVTNVDNSGLAAYDGAVLSLPNVGEARRTDGNDRTWYAEGAGSRVVLGELTNLISYPDGGWWRLRTYNGGRLELPAVKTMTNGWFSVYAEGANAVVDLSGLIKITSRAEGITIWRWRPTTEVRLCCRS